MAYADYFFICISAIKNWYLFSMKKDNSTGMHKITNIVARFTRTDEPPQKKPPAAQIGLGTHI